MFQSGQLIVSVAGFLLLAASLVSQKKAGYLALAGAAALAILAVWEADPTLALGVLALVAARFVRPPRKKSPLGQADGRPRPGHPSRIRP